MQKVGTITAEQLAAIRGEDTTTVDPQSPPHIPPPQGISTPPPSVWTQKAHERAHAAATAIVGGVGNSPLIHSLNIVKY